MVNNIKISKTSNYVLTLKSDLKVTTFYLRRINIPSMSFGITELFHQGLSIKTPGDSLKFGTVNMDIIIDRDFLNYEELYKEMTNGHDVLSGVLRPSKKVFQSTLIMLSNKNNPVAKITFDDLIIEEMGDIDLDITTVDSLIMQVTAQFTNMTFERLNNV
jgi:hypothetical protein